jgi:hypothetical protein
MALAPQIQKIVYKINAGQELTHAEEVICFTVIHGYTKEEAERLVYIASKREPSRISD